MCTGSACPWGTAVQLVAKSVSHSSVRPMTEITRYHEERVIPREVRCEDVAELLLFAEVDCPNKDGNDGYVQPVAGLSASSANKSRHRLTPRRPCERTANASRYCVHPHRSEFPCLGIPPWPATV